MTKLLDGKCRRREQQVGMLVVVFDFLVLWYYFFSGTTALRPMAGLFWIGIVVVGMFLFRVKTIALTPYMVLAIIGVVAIGISVPTSVDMGTSAKYTLSIALYLLVAYQITMFSGNQTILLALMMMFSIVMLWATYIQAFFPDIYSSFILPFIPLRFHERVILFMNNESYVGFYNQTSANAVAMSLGCCICLYFHSRSQSSIRKLISMVALLLFLYGVVLTNRRGSTLVITVLIGCYLWKRIREPYAKVLLVFGLGVVAFSGVWKDIPLIQNLLNKTEKYASEGDITNGRFAIWGESLLLFLNKPVLGYGADMYGYVATAGYAHNSYLQSLAELGLPGAVLFYTPFFYGLRRTIRLFKLRYRLGQREQSIVDFCLYWQLYCFVNAVFESFFATEVSVFMIYVSQMMCIRIAECNSLDN